MRLTDVTCAFLKITEGIWLKLYGIVSFIHCIDFFLTEIHKQNWKNAKCVKRKWKNDRSHAGEDRKCVHLAIIWFNYVRRWT